MPASPYAGRIVCAHCGRTLLPAGEERATVRCACGRESRIFRFHPFRQAAVTAAAPSAGSPCAFHAGNQASASCTRCGSFLCELCVTPVQGKVYCTACFGRLKNAGTLGLSNRYPRPHAVALSLSIASLVTCAFAAPLALPLATWQWIKAYRTRNEILEREGSLYPALIAAPIVSLLSLIAFALIAMGNL